MISMKRAIPFTLILIILTSASGCISLEDPFMEQYYENEFEVNIRINDSNYEYRYLLLPAPVQVDFSPMARDARIISGNGTYWVEDIDDESFMPVFALNITMNDEITVRFFERVNDYNGNQFSEFSLCNGIHREGSQTYRSYVSYLSHQETITVSIYCRNLWYSEDKLEDELDHDETIMEIDGKISSDGWSSDLVGVRSHIIDEDF